MQSNITKLVLLFFCGGLLSGCNHTWDVIQPSQRMKIETTTSSALFLPPPSKQERHVFLQVNSMQQNATGLNRNIISALKSKGFRFTNHPEQAHYVLQIEVLQHGIMDKTAANIALNGGYGRKLPEEMLPKKSTDNNVTALLLDVQIAHKRSTKTQWQRYQTRLLSLASKDKPSDSVTQMIYTSINQEMLKLLNANVS